MLIDIFFLIGIPGLLIVLLAIVAHGIWFLITVYRKRWPLVVVQITVPIVLLLGLGMVAQVMEKRRHANYLANIFGTSVDLQTPIFVYYSPREFNGDGYSIEVYPLPAALDTVFVHRDPAHLAHFPKTTDFRTGWAVQPWLEGPLAERHLRHVDFALSSIDSANVPGLEAQFADIRKRLGQSQVFYAFVVKDDGDHISNIDFYMVDLVGERLYLINQNT